MVKENLPHTVVVRYALPPEWHGVDPMPFRCRVHEALARNFHLFQVYGAYDFSSDIPGTPEEGYSIQASVYMFPEKDLGPIRRGLLKLFHISNIGAPDFSTSDTEALEKS